MQSLAVVADDSSVNVAQRKTHPLPDGIWVNDDRALHPIEECLQEVPLLDNGSLIVPFDEAALLQHVDDDWIQCLQRAEI